MNMPPLYLGGLVVGMAGALVGWVLQMWHTGRRMGSVKARVRQLIEEAERSAEELKKEAQKETDRELRALKERTEHDISRSRRAIGRLEQKLAKRESVLDKKMESAEGREKEVARKETETNGLRKTLDKEREELQERVDEITQRYEEISGMTAEQAKQALMENLESQVRQEAGALVRRVEGEARETAVKKARQIITLAVQKYAAEQVSETAISVVNLPSDEIKGRIIGREGRNIRALEAATGCNFIVDDTPEAVVLSCFDPLRREIARLSLESLLSDGRIHPGRIEDVVQKVEKQVHESIREVGEQSAFDLGVNGLHSELVRLLGRLKYRTSYGQNVLKHSIEVANLAKIMAAELGVDAQLAKRAGALHDIGKAVSYEMEGTHAAIGAELAKKYGEPPAIVHAIAAHHAEEEPRTIVAVLVQASDAISAARPGARRETLETYIKRLKQLESIADSFEGVDKSYAIQAGREIRILVDPDRI
ncbi:MAG TPA: ribonuclease Y, partial [Sumerlaeia bacterium]|nr:ribonuclease Y [Sumerlaeia bacterium]